MKRIALVIVAVMFAAGGPAAQDLERLFKAAVNTETVDRNLEAAIEQYRKVAAGGNRALAAQALLRMAECYRQLGNDTEAERLYEDIVRDYADQRDAVTLARSRLGRPMGPARATGDRIVWRGAATTDGDGRVSPDGRFISYVSWGGPKGLNLMLHDVVSGTDRAITDVDWNGGAAGDSAFSPDGKHLAYGWNTYSQRGQLARRELRVIALGGGASQARTLYTSTQHAVNPLDWSRDGQTLAVRVSLPDRTPQIGVVRMDGSLRVLKTLDDWRAVGKIFFSPDGKYLAYDAPAGDADQRRDVFIIAADGSVETPLLDPADDAVMGWSPDGRHLLLASDRSGRVDLWAVPVANGRPTGVPPVRVKTDIGAVASQGLTAAGALYVVKDASSMNLQVAPIDLEAGRLTGPATIQIFRTETPAFSPDGKLMAYQARSPSGQAHLAIRDLASNRVRELRLPMAYMPTPQWFSDGRSLVIAGRDTRGRNRVMRVDAETGAEIPIAGGGQVSPDGTKVYSTVGPNNRSKIVVEHDLATGSTREIFKTPDATGAPRLSPDGRLFAVVRTPSIDSVNPEGKTSTVIIAAVADGAVRELSVPAVLQAYRGFDWTPDSQALLVAADGTASGPGLWLVPVNGGAPRKLPIDTTAWIASMGIRLHPDGKQIAYFTGEPAREVWALQQVIPARP